MSGADCRPKPSRGRAARRGSLALIGMLAATLLFATAETGEAAPTVTAELLRVIHTSRWTPESPDPTGLSYSRSPTRLLVVDAEVDETTSPEQRSNLFITTVRGALVRTRSVMRSSSEPEDIAWRNRSTVYLVDDNSRAVYRVRAGSDQRIGTRDDRRSLTLDTRSFQSRDPEGLAWCPASRSLIVTDQRRGRVFHVRPGGDGRLGTGDDRVRSFRSSSVGVSAPEGVEFDTTTGHLLLVGASGELIAETTLRGKLVRTIDISAAAIINASSITLVPDPADPDSRHIVVSDKGIDPELDPHENDGRLFVFDHPA